MDAPSNSKISRVQPGAFAVTAGHVFFAYQNAKGTAREIECKLGNVPFEPEATLICYHESLDIATFRLSEQEFEQINTPMVTAGPPHWEPLNPTVGNFAFFAGYPENSRRATSSGDFSTAPYFAMPKITSVSDRQIACRLDREKLIGLGGSELPPVGYSTSGVSGGPLLLPTLVRDSEVESAIWRLGGVIVQEAEGAMFEQFVAVREHYIHSDGRIG